jgi:hypothetical protein
MTTMTHSTEVGATKLSKDISTHPTEYVSTLGQAVRCFLAEHIHEHKVSPALIDALLQEVKGIWRYECNAYQDNHPEFRAPDVRGSDGKLQRVLPVAEALIQAPRLVTIGLARVYRHVKTASERWQQLGLAGDIATYKEEDVFEEE